MSANLAFCTSPWSFPLRPGPGAQTRTLCTSFGLIVGKRTTLTKKTFKLQNKSVNREHDKDPDTFFEILCVLIKEGLHFRLSVHGDQFYEVPPVFGESKDKLIASGQCHIVDIRTRKSSRQNASNLSKKTQVLVPQSLKSNETSTGSRALQMAGPTVPVHGRIVTVEITRPTKQTASILLEGCVDVFNHSHHAIGHLINFFCKDYM